MQTCDFRGISERTASFSRPDVFTEIKCVDPINLNGHWFCNWLKFAGMLALCCIHGFIVRQQKSATVFRRMLLDSCYLFSSLLSADIFSQIQFYPPPPKKKKNNKKLKNKKLPEE